MWSTHPRRAFTLVEIIVVVTIISILAGSLYFFASQASAVSRDADRQSDLRRIQGALEEYKRVNGRYPEGCRGPDQWSGEQGTDFACAGGSTQYIINFVPNFLDRLPSDPRRGDCPAVGACERGYAYITNVDGSVYKLIAMNTVESEIVGYDHPLKSCDIYDRTNNDIRISGMCGVVCSEQYCLSGGRTAPRADNTHWCSPTSDPNNPSHNHRFLYSYAVWGGFAPLNATISNPLTCHPGGKCVDEYDPLNTFTGSPTAAEILSLRLRAVFQTTSIICR